MSAWRSIKDWTRTIIGCGALLVVTIVVGAATLALLLIFVDPDMLAGFGVKKLDALKSDEEKKAAQKEAFVEHLKKLPAPGQLAKKSLGRPIGKIVVISNGNFDPLHGELPPNQVAKTPEEIDAVAVITRSERVVGVYNNGVLFVLPNAADGPNAAKRAVISITIIEPDNGDKIHVSSDIFGPPPPPFLAKGATPAPPEAPRQLALKYLAALPRKATGKVILSIDGSLDDSDPADPVLAKKLAKVRTHMKDHTVALEANKGYVIAMESDAFDPHLRVEHAGKQVAAHRDLFGTHKARIAFTPTQAGEYRIVAACFDGKTGAYRLTVQEAD